MFTDGYIDQYGANDKESFNRKRFKTMLLEIYNLDAATQKNLIYNKMKNWKGDTKQFDDMLVVGFKV